MPNTPPTLNDFASSVTFAENAVNAAPALIDSNVDFRDLDNNYTFGTLVVSGLLAEDRIAIRNEGFGAGQIGLFGSNLTYGGVAIGTFAGGVGATLTVTFNSSANAVAVDALIQNLTYANVSDTPTASRTLRLNVFDSAGGSLQGATSFAEVTGAANPFNGLPAAYASAPSFVDLDGDGDLDAVIGNTNGQFQVFGNTGGVFSVRTGSANPLASFDVGTNSRPSFVDLDGDGDRDMVVGNQAGTLESFRNTAGVFTRLTGAANPFNALNFGNGSSPGFVDLDGDGDLDAVVGSVTGTLIAFRNDAGAFTRITALGPFNGVDVGTYSAPSFGDLDGDGDQDSVVGAGDGTLHTFRNDNGVFTELTGSANPFNGVDIGTGAAASLVDLDGDGDLDAVVGHQDGSLRTFRNTTVGAPAIVINVTAESDVPTLSGVAASVTLGENAVNAAPVLLDAEVDFVPGSSALAGGRLIVAGLLFEDRVSVRDQGSGAGQIGLSGNTVSYGGVAIGTVAGGIGNTFTVTFGAAATGGAVDALIQNLTYANVSDTPAPSRALTINVIDSAGGAALPAPDYGEVTGTANPFNGIAIGYAAPQFADLDGDGDLDIAIGRQGVVRTFRNDGGAYTELTGGANPFGGIGNLSFNATLAFYDRDGDGDLDVVLGRDGFGIGLVSLRNDNGTFVQLTGADDPFAAFTFDRSIVPAMVDLDGDRDFDLALGLHNGTMTYFRNDGGTYVQQTGAANPFAAVSVSSYASPAFADLDGDGDLDMVVGNGNGFVRTYRNDNQSFVAVTGAADPLDGAIVQGGGNYGRRPTFADTDGDGDLDLIVGQWSGPLRFARNDAAPAPTITVNVTAESEAASLSGLAPAVTFAENAVNAAPSLLDADVTFVAGTAGLAGGTLTLSGLLAEDRVAVRNEGAGAGQIGVSGSDVTFGGVVIGTIAEGAGGALSVTFNADVTEGAIEALIENLTYANTSDSPTASRTLSLDVTDTAGGHLNGGTQSIAVTVTPEAEGPRIAGLATALTFAENAVNAAPALIDADVIFTSEAGDLTGGTLIVSGLLAEDRVAIRNQGESAGQIGLFGANVTYGGVAIGTFAGGAGGTLVVTLNSGATTAAVDALIQNLTYANASDTPTASRTLALTVTDAAGASVAGQIAVSVTAESEPALAAADSAQTSENATVSIAVLSNDSDADGPAPSVAMINGIPVSSGGIVLASGAIVTLEADGTLTYDPNGKFGSLIAAGAGTGAVNTAATESFTYTLADGGMATVTVTVNGVPTMDDQLAGDGANNVIVGTDGDDLFMLHQGGSDTVVGGAGNDGFYFGALLDPADRIDGGGGTSDQLGIQGNYAGYTFGAANLVGMETLVILSGADTRFGGDGSGRFGYDLTTIDANVADGARLTVNANMLLAGEDLRFDGSAETDGSFFVYAGQGSDTLIGGAQSDAFFFGNDGRFTAADSVDGRGGADDQLALCGDYAVPLTLQATSMAGIETLVLMSAADTRYAQGGTPFGYNLVLDDGNVAAGQALTISANNLRSGENATVDGSAETDGSLRFIMGGGDDVLSGGAGNDHFYGRLGQDVMTGGGGDDIFYFRGAAESQVSAMDAILDFAAGDRIDLSAIDAITGGANNAFAFIGGGAFSSTAGELHVTGAGANWTLEGDTNGDGVADFAVAITTPGGHVFTALDFVL